MDEEFDNDENLSSEEETFFAREFTEAVQRTSSNPIKFSRYSFI